MARRYRWKMSPGETLPLGCSLEDDLATGETLTGTPTITVHEETSPDVWADRSDDFTIASAAVNTAEMTDANGDAIPIGKGVSFELTATTTIGVYEVLVSCASTDGTNPAVPNELKVSGPAVS